MYRKQACVCTEQACENTSAPVSIYLINQTLGGPLVRALRARAGILLLINQRILPRGSESIVLKIQFSLFLSLFKYHNSNTKVIIIIFDIIDSLSNFIFRYIYYSSIFIILKGEIQC